MKNRIQLIYKILPFLIIFIWIVLLFGNTLLPPKGQVIYGGDLLTQFYFWKSFLVTSLKDGFIPWWNPYNFSGTPFLAHPSSGFFYPFVILFLILPIDIAFSWNYFLHFLIAAVGMYLLGKKYSNNWGGLSASLIFITSGFFSSRIFAGHVEILSTASWIPLVFLTFDNYFQNPARRNLIYFILIFSLQILAGYQMVVIFTLELLLLFSVFKIITNYKNDNQIIKKLLILGFGTGLAVCLTGIYWIPTMQFVNLSIRSKGLPYEMASWGAMPMDGWKLMFISPFDTTALNKLSYGFGDSTHANFFDYYLGIVPLILLIITPILIMLQKKISEFKVLSGKILPIYIFLLTTAVIFILISLSNLSRFNLHFVLYKLIPFYRYVRIPDQHLVVTVFTVSLLTGIIIGSIKWRILRIIFIAGVCIPLFTFSRNYFFLTDVPELLYSRDLVNYLKTDKSLYRVLPDYRVASPLRETFEANLSSYYSIQSAAGYDPVILSSYYKFINILNKEKNSDDLLSYYYVEVPPTDTNSPLNNFLNIKYIIVGSSWENVWKKDNKFAKIQSDASYAMYENKNVYKRFYFVPNFRFYENIGSLEDDLINKSDELINTVYLLKRDAGLNSIDSTCPDKITSEIYIKSFKPNEIMIDADVPCNGFLSSSEVYYPGWKAEIDGKLTTILKSNLAFRAVKINKGKHIVRMYYSPEIYYLGGLVSLFGLTILLIFIKPHFIIRHLMKIRK